MKKTITFLAILIATTLFAQNTNVPGDNFETYLETHDASGNTVAMGDATSMGNGVMDDYVPTANISSVTTLNVSNQNISDLTGIQDFAALTTLLCISNNLQDIDVTQNTALTTLNCASNSLSNIDVSNNIALTTLNIGDNYFTGIDVSNNTLLQLLIVSTNQITDLDLSNNTSLTSLLCSSNLLTRLDVSQNAALSLLYCYSNLLTDLDLSANTALTQLLCNSNHLTNLNMQNGNNSNITNNNFKAFGNPYLSCILVDDAAYSTANWHQIDTIASFNETACTQMTYVPDDNFEQALIDLGHDSGALDNVVLTANISGLTTLDVHSKNISDLTGIEDFTTLQILTCNINNLTSLNLSNNTALIELNCQGNHLTNLNISNCTALTILGCFSNQLAILDLSDNIALTNLYCYSNPLNDLDVSNNTALTSLFCASNGLMTLDVSQNTALVSLICYGNQLTHLDISQNTALTNFRCDYNQLTTLNMQNGNNTNIINNDFYAYHNPNLTCILVDDAAWSTTNWTNIDATSTFVNNQAECDALSVAENSFKTQINLYPNPAKNNFTIQNNSNYTLENLSIYDMLGKLVLQTNNTNNTIDVSTLKNGIYLVKMISNSNKIAIQKIVINK